MGKQSCLVISSPYSWGGGIKSMIDEGLRMIESLGYKSTMVMPSYIKGVNDRREEFKKISTLEFLSFDKYPLLHHLIFGLRLRNFLREHDIALAIVATSHTALPLALSNKPFCIWLATTYSDELRAKYNSGFGDKPARRLRNSIQWQFLEKIEKYVLRKATSILALSDYTASQLLDLEPSIKAKIHVFNIPIDSKIFFPKKSIRKIPKLLINTGRINDPRKNTQLLIESFAEIKKSIPEARLLLIGELPNDSLVKLIKALSLEKHIEIVPETPRIQLVDYLRKAEIFVATPTQEGLGISILEAMSCGLPVVITSCGGPTTLIQESGGGLITKSNKKDFSDSVIKLLANENLGTTLGLRGRRYIQKHLSFSSQEKRLRQELDKQYEKQ